MICSLFTWHDVLGIQWFGVNGSVYFFKKVPCSCEQKQELCHKFGLLLPSLTASWLFRWHICYFCHFLKRSFTKSHNVDFWITDLTLHSCLTVCYQNHVSVLSKHWGVCVCTSKSVWFWCRLQGSQVSDVSFFLMDMSVFFFTVKASSSVLPNPQVILVDVVTFGFVSTDSRSCLSRSTGNESVRGEGFTYILFKCCFRENSIIGFSPKCF